MPALLPDWFTAFGMLTIVALTVAWVMWVLGRKYGPQGMALAIASTLLYAVAYLFNALQFKLESVLLVIASQLCMTAAIAVFTIAVQRFNQRISTHRDAVTLLLPLVAALLLAVFYRPQDTAPWNQLQSAISSLQMAYLLLLMLRMRSGTLGLGWWLVMLTTAVQIAAIPLLNWVYHLNALEVTSHAPLMGWLTCLSLLLPLMLTGIGFLIMLQDREAAVEQDIAQLDALTQLPNRAALVRNLQLSTETAAQLQQPLSVMVLDIDHFKSVNDNYGHLVGDKVIQSIACTLRDEGRSSDFSARYGGEEFVVVLPNTNARDAFRLAERLCQTVRKNPMPLPNGRLLHITISVGVYAGMPTHGSTWERLVAAADEAMYVAKRNGRDRVAMSTPIQSMKSQATRVDMHQS